MTDTEYHQLRLLSALTVLLAAALAGPSLLAVDVYGDSGEKTWIEAVSDDEDDDNIEVALDMVDWSTAYVEGKLSTASVPLVGDPPRVDATSTAESLREHIAANSTDYQNYLNSRLSATSDRDVVAVHVENESTTESLYLVADVENQSYRNVTAVNATDRTVDHECTLSGAAAEHAPEELDTFHSEYVVPNKSVDDSYLGRLAGAYGSDVDCTFPEMNT